MIPSNSALSEDKKRQQRLKRKNLSMLQHGWQQYIASSFIGVSHYLSLLSAGLNYHKSRSSALTGKISNLLAILFWFSVTKFNIALQKLGCCDGTGMGVENLLWDFNFVYN
jgi:hypothetical protein